MASAALTDPWPVPWLSRAAGLRSEQESRSLHGPNGSGKSSLCEALEYTLRGAVEEAGSKRIEQRDYLANIHANQTNQKSQNQPNQQTQGGNQQTGQNAPGRDQEVGSKNQQGGRMSDDDQRGQRQGQGNQTDGGMKHKGDRTNR